MEFTRYTGESFAGKVISIIITGKQEYPYESYYHANSKKNKYFY